MSDEKPQVEPTVEDKLFRMMADQQDEFQKFRDNAQARLAHLERERGRKSRDFSFDLERLAGYAALLVFGLIVARVIVYALASYERKRENDGLENLPVSEA